MVQRVVIAVSWLLAAAFATRAHADPADSVRWLPLFDSARSAHLHQVETFGQLCFYGEEPIVAPTIERRVTMNRRDLRRFGRVLFRSIPAPGHGPAFRGLSLDSPQLAFELRFRTGEDSVHVRLRQIWSREFFGEITRARRGAVVDSLAIRRADWEVWPEWDNRE